MLIALLVKLAIPVPRPVLDTGKDRAYVAMLDNDLGDAAYRSGDLNEAERVNRAALDEYRKLPEGTYVEMAATLSNLGAVLIKRETTPKPSHSCTKAWSSAGKCWATRTPIPP
jgi:hypothetical protein